MGFCARCGAELPPQRNPGRPRKWCSETCRVRAYEAAHPKPPPAPRSRVWFLRCEICSGQFAARSSRRRTCGVECAAERKRRAYRDRYALDRDAELQRHRERRANATLEQRLQNRARNQRRRAVVFGADAEEFSPLEIYERDDWICQLCFEPIDSTLVYPDPGSPSLDHTVPLSRGGRHTRANTRASHLHCNCSRGNRDVQLTPPDMGACPDKGGTNDGRTRPRTERPQAPSWTLAV